MSPKRVNHLKLTITTGEGAALGAMLDTCP